MARKATLPVGLYLRGPAYWMDFMSPTGERHRASLKTADLATAKAILEKEKARIVAEAHGLAPRETTIEGFKTEYLKAARTRMAPHVWAQRKRRLDGFFSFCKVARPDAIRPEHISGYAAWRLETGKRPAGKNDKGEPMMRPIKRVTVLAELKTLKAALRWAVRHDYLERNPFDRCDPFKGDQERPIDFLTVEERDRLLDACGDPVPLHGRGGKGKGNTRSRVIPLRAMAAVAVFAGLRLGELLWLDWEDFDFTTNEIRVRPKDGWKPKTPRLCAIPLFPPLRAILEAVRLTAGPVFTTQNGERIERRNALTALELAAKRARIGKPVNWNILRHCFATTLASAGVPLFSIGKWMGHKSTATTEKFYAAFCPNQSLVAQAAAALSPAQAPSAMKKPEAATVIRPPSFAAGA